MVHGIETIWKINEAASKVDGTHSPLSELKAALKADDDYAWTWLCNLACIGLDCSGDHQSANRYAAQFMKNAFDVDVSTQENWKRFEAQWASNKPENQISPPLAKAIDALESRIANVEAHVFNVDQNILAIAKGVGELTDIVSKLTDRIIGLEQRSK